MDNQTSLTLPPPWYIADLDQDPNLRSGHTRKQYRWAISHFDAWRENRPLTVTLLESYLVHLQGAKLSPSTQKQALAAIRWLARRAVKRTWDTRTADEAREFEAGIRRLLEIKLKRQPSPLPAGRYVTPDEIKRLLAVCDDGTPAGIRDAAMFAVAFGTACRNEELRRITLSDVELLTVPTPRVRITIQHGKGDKPRVIYIKAPALLERLTRWLDLRGSTGEFLFTPINKSGKIFPLRGLSYTGAVNILYHRQLAAGLDDLNWHDTRRSAISNLFGAGVDVSTILAISGHTSERTALRYDRRGEERLEDALEKVQSLLA